MGEKCNRGYKADVLKLTDEIVVSATCRQIRISTKAVYNWRQVEQPARNDVKRKHHSGGFV